LGKRQEPENAIPIGMTRKRKGSTGGKRENGGVGTSSEIGRKRIASQTLNPPREKREMVHRSVNEATRRGKIRRRVKPTTGSVGPVGGGPQGWGTTFCTEIQNLDRSL